MSIKYPPDLADRVAKLLSEILTDKYGDEYNCKITLRRKKIEPTKHKNGGAHCA